MSAEHLTFLYRVRYASSCDDGCAHAATLPDSLHRPVFILYSIGQVTISPSGSGRNRNTSGSRDGTTMTLAAGQQALHEDGVGQAEALSLDGVGLAGEARHVGTPGVERAEHLLEPGGSLRCQVLPLGE